MWSAEVEVNERISNSIHVFSLLRQIWKSRKISSKTKLRMFQTGIISVLLDEDESWKTSKGLEDGLDVFQRKCLR